MKFRKPGSRFLLFAIKPYECQGGMGDYVESFATKREAVRFAEAEHQKSLARDKENHNWALSNVMYDDYEIYDRYAHTYYSWGTSAKSEKWEAAEPVKL